MKIQHCSHNVATIRRPNSSYVTTKLFGMYNTIFSERAIFTFPTVDVCRARWPGCGQVLVIRVKVERCRHCWINYFSCSKFRFCLSHDHHHRSAAVSRGLEKASACPLQVSLSCAVLCRIVSLQYLSMWSLHRLAWHLKYYYYIVKLDIM